MKLFAFKDTGYICNTFEITGDGISTEDFIKSCTSFSKFALPEQIFELTVEDPVKITLLPDALGHNTEYYYDPDKHEILGEYVPNQYILEKDINLLKEELTSSDYRVVKAYEKQLAGEIETEYDFNQLHLQRQELRDKINSLQTILTDLQNNDKK